LVSPIWFALVIFSQEGNFQGGQDQWGQIERQVEKR